MRRDGRRDEERLRDMLEHIDAALAAGKDRSQFDADPILRKSIFHDILCIGEAAKKVSEDLREKYPSVPWRPIGGMRNQIAHEYFSIDHEMIWQTITGDLAPLRTQIDEILRAEFPDGSELA
jgi:uncharacterized protein with HEPN domain